MMKKITDKNNNTPCLAEKVDDYEPGPEKYAAIYARKSTTLENNSIESQTALAKNVLTNEDLLLYDIYADEESATKYHPLHRPGFRRLLYDAEAGCFKTLIVYRRDRLARRVDDIIEIRKLFKRHGIKIIYSNKGEYQPSDSYLSNFIENIIIAVDELEPKILSERIASGKLEKRLRGEYSGRAPFGYFNSESKDENDDCDSFYDNVDKKYKPKGKKYADLIKYIFSVIINLSEESYHSESYISDINKFALQLGVSKKFYKSNIINIVRNPVYANFLLIDPHTQFTEILYSNSDQAEVNIDYFKQCINVKEVIDMKTWCSAILALEKITNELKFERYDVEEYLLKHLLVCGDCKEKMRLIDGNYKCKNGCTDIPEIQAQYEVIGKIIDDFIYSNSAKEYIESQIEFVEKYTKKLTRISSRSTKRIETLLLKMIKQRCTESNSLKRVLARGEKIKKDLAEK